MGDVGRPLTEAQLEPLCGRVDVLFALAGAGLTIALDDLDEAIARIGPAVVIPMHYRTPSLRYDVGPLEDFLAHRARRPRRPPRRLGVRVRPRCRTSSRCTC